MATIGTVTVLTILLALGSVQTKELLNEKPEDLTFFIPPIPVVSKEQIQDVLSRARTLCDKAKQNPAAVATAIAAAVGTLPPIPFNQAFRVLKALPAEVQVHLPAAVDLLARIRGLGTFTECRRRFSGRGAPVGANVLIATNLNNCEEIMPYWILEVLRLALLMREDPTLTAIYVVQSNADGFKLEATPPPSHRVGISVYESGSTDNTPAWLLVAEALWNAASIPNTIVLNGTLTRQMSLLDTNSGRLYKQHRIQHLANLRNSALVPLYDKPESYQYVMFINDIFFCAPDLMRLTYLEADIACGVDVEVWAGGHAPKIQDAGHRNRGRLLRRRLLMQGMGGGGAGSDTALAAASSSSLRAAWKIAVELMSNVHTDEATRQGQTKARIAGAVVKPRYEFYDIWVSRDIGGRAFIKHDPIARDLRTVDSLHRGLPFPVKCCWNGAVFLNASHLAAGLRFRAGMRGDGECDASECSLFCEDYRRLGSGRVAIDPSVRVSYAPWTEDVHGPLPGGLPPKVPWSAVRRSGALEKMQAQWLETASDMNVECVPLRRGFDGADLDRVHMVDLRRDNFTALYLDRLRQPSPPPSRSCNLMMGGYGAVSEGDFFDDLSYGSWGKNPITKLVWRAGEFVNSLQAVYGLTPARVHGGFDGELREHAVEGGEFINSAVVYYDERAVHGLDLGTSVGRRIVIGTLREGVSRARATPCPADEAHEGRYRLIAFAGTADRYLRSITLMWS